MTLKDCQAKYEARLRMKGVRDNTYADYCKKLDMLILFFGENRDPKTVLSSDVVAYYKSRKAQGRADSTIDRELQSGLMFWNFIERELEEVERHMNPFIQARLRQDYRKKWYDEMKASKAV